jgi:uncharacterized coiled-coil DUF342 family protein
MGEKTNRRVELIKNLIRYEEKEHNLRKNIQYLSDQIMSLQRELRGQMRELESIVLQKDTILDEYYDLLGECESDLRNFLEDGYV